MENKTLTFEKFLKEERLNTLFKILPKQMQRDIENRYNEIIKMNNTESENEENEY